MLKAAESGDSYAMYAYGLMIVKGEVLFTEREVGIKWLKKAAEKGEQAAIDLLEKL